MMQTSTNGCGCGCGGAPRHVGGAFVRPRFFQGQLLTEDDLQALTGYITGKDRLRNRLLFGPGVVCGLEVACDPCGGGKVTVRPGYALDCCGHDIVVDCAEQVDVAALIHDLRVGSLGVDCGDPCDSTGREYGLYVRYAEEGIEPIAPYATDESCPPIDCSPSRIRETFRFVVKCVEPTTGHRYDPATRLTARLGDRRRLDPVRADADRLGRYADPMRAALRASGRTVRFDPADADRYHAARLALEAMTGQPSAEEVRALTEHVRALASALARYDSYDRAGRDRLGRDHSLGDVDAVRQRLADAVPVLAGAVDTAWSDPRDRALARAVLEEARDRVVLPDTTAPLEKAMLAQGAPLSYALRAELATDLRRLREWLLVRFDSGGELTDCSLRPAVSGVDLPPALPATPPTGGALVSPGELSTAGTAAGTLGSAVLRYVADVVCASTLPSCGDCTDGDVLLARLEVADCDVVRICAAGREQWLPGGPAYAAWAPKLYEARALAEKVCCQPPPVPPGDGADDDPSGPVALTYLPHLFGGQAPRGDLDRLLDLLSPPDTTQPGAGQPGADRSTRDEVAELRAQVGALTELVTGLRRQLTGVDRTEWSGSGEPETAGSRPDQSSAHDAGRAAEPPETAGTAEPDRPEREAPARKAPARKAPARRPRGPRSGDRES